METATPGAQTESECQTLNGTETASRPGLTHTGLRVHKGLCDKPGGADTWTPTSKGAAQESPIDHPPLSVPHSAQLQMTQEETGQRQPQVLPWSPPVARQCGAPPAEPTRLSRAGGDGDGLGPVREKGLRACSQSTSSHLKGLLLGQEICPLWGYRRVTHWAQNLLLRKGCFSSYLFSNSARTSLPAGRFAEKASRQEPLWPGPASTWGPASHLEAFVT